MLSHHASKSRVDGQRESRVPTQHELAPVANDPHVGRVCTHFDATHECGEVHHRGHVVWLNSTRVKRASNAGSCAATSGSPGAPTSEMASTDQRTSSSVNASFFMTSPRRVFFAKIAWIVAKTPCVRQSASKQLAQGQRTGGPPALPTFTSVIDFTRFGVWSRAECDNGSLP